MSKIQGTGGGFTPMTPVETEKAEDAESGQSVRDVQKQVAATVTKRVEISDGLELKRDAGLLTGLKDPIKQENAQKQLDQEYMPEAKLIIEDAYKTRIDPQVALKLKDKLTNDPHFMAAVENLRDIVEGFAQDALKQQELQAQNPQPKAEPPKPSEQTQQSEQIQQTQQSNAQQQANQTAQTQNATQQSNTQSQEQLTTTQTDGAKNDAAKTDAAKNDATLTETNKNETTKNDTQQTDTTNDAAKTDAAKTDAANTEQQTEDAKALPPEGEGQKLSEAPLTQSADDKAIEDANATNAAQDLSEEDELEEAPETKVQGNDATKEGVFPGYPQGEIGTLDEHGQLIVDQESYDAADKEFKDAGIDGPFMQGYTALMNLSLQPVITSNLPPEGGGYHSEAADDGTVGGAGSAGYPTGSSQAGASGAVTNFGTTWAVMGDYPADADVGELAYILLAETIREIGRDMKAAQQLMRMRHLINDAMRKEFADFLNATSRLTKADVKDPRDIDKVEWVNKEPRPIFDEEGNCIDIQMVEVPIEQTFDKVHIDAVGGKSSTEVNLTAAEVADQYLPPDGKAEAAGNEPYGPQPDGTFIAKTSHIYVSAATVEARREAYRTKLKAMKQDMEKEQLNVQKFMGMRKQVLENLTKLIKNRAEEQSKIIAQMRK